MGKKIQDRMIFDIRSFSSDVLIFSFGQCALLIFGLIQSLIIPKYFSTVDYGYWQLFLLLTTYVGIVHLGFLDGIYVRWAGKDLETIREEIPMAFMFILLELGVIVGFLILFVKCVNIMSMEVALTVLIYSIIFNLLAFFVYIAQATKRFKLVTTANIGKGLLFLIFVLIVFLCSSFSFYLLVLATFFSSFIILIFFVIYFRDSLFHYNTSRISLLQYGKENIGIGFFILLGNFIALFFTTIDRLTVGSFFAITQFAVYAFAMTMCGLAMMFLQAVSQVFFPYLSGSSSEIRIKAYSLIRPALVIFWAGMLAAFFPISVFLTYYLPKYIDSLPLMAILICTIGFSGQINILHANFFKVYRKQRAFFVLAGAALVIAIALNLFAVFIFGTLTSVAATAVISFCIWYFLNEVALRNLVAVSVWEIIRWAFVIGAYIGAFLFAYTSTESWIIGFGIYVILFLCITIICLNSEIKQLWKRILEITQRKNDV